ncbi:hypothetical protein [Streptomyces griseoflavus]|uniref:hypothetical protein n=1 Tax=Streptomyces griseoflavus TaxID=35619 RepID=UPI00131A26B5|nr:hypothetical protein [Streptomyces griseoflavus]
MNHEMATAWLTLDPPGPNGDETIIASLRQDLLSIPNVKKVDPILAENSQTDEFLTRKSGTAIGVAGIAATLAPFALRQVVAMLKAWTERQAARTIIIEIEGDRLEIKAGSNREQRHAMDLFLQRHTPTPELPSRDESPAGD